MTKEHIELAKAEPEKVKQRTPFLEKLGCIAFAGLVAVGVVHHAVDYASDQFRQTSQGVLTDAQARAKETGGQLIVNLNTESVNPLKKEVEGVKQNSGSIAEKLPELTTTTTLPSVNTVPNEQQLAGDTVTTQASSTTTTTAP